VLQALWIWRQFPRQIASDLRPLGLHIKHWLRGTQGADGDLILSSYELLEILEFLPDDSAFKTWAERGGRWVDWKRMLAESVNESYRMRSSYLAVNSENGSSAFDTEDYEFMDPIDAEARVDADGHAEAETSDSVTRFESDISFE
jgi:hypothetical protein